MNSRLIAEKYKEMLNNKWDCKDKTIKTGKTKISIKRKMKTHKLKNNNLKILNRLKACKKSINQNLKT